MRLPIRSAAIILNDDRILLIERKKNGRQFYVFPGGGVEEGETNEEAAVREVLEETSVNVSITRLLYHHHYLASDTSSRDSDQYFFLAKYESGEPKLQTNTNEAMSQINTDGEDSYNPMWIKVATLQDKILYPLEIRDWLIEDLLSGFKKETRSEAMEFSKRRQ